MSEAAFQHIQMVEDADEHQALLHEAPLSGQAGEYLGALSMGMTEKGAVEAEPERNHPP